MRHHINQVLKAETTKNTELVLVLLVSFGLLSAIVLPSVSIGGISLYLITLISPILIAIIFFFWIHNSPLIHSSALAPLALGGMVLTSAIASWAMGLSSVNGRDVIEAVKYVQFLPYLMAIVFLRSYSLRLMHNFILAASIVVLILGYIQVFQVPILTEWITLVYLSPNSSHLDSLGQRITITGSDPNIAGVISCFFCIYYAALFFLYKKNRYVLISILFFYLCFATQSRTALISFIFSMSFYYLLFYKSNIFLKFVFLTFSLASVVFLVFYLDLSYIYIGIQYALEGRNNSLNVRFENIYMAVQRFLEHPVFGMGPMKTQFSTTIDSEYALILQRYGLLGIIVFGSYLVYLYKLASRNLQTHWGITLFVFTIMSLLIMVTNNIFSGYQLMAIIILLNIACVLNERNQNHLKREASL